MMNNAELNKLGYDLLFSILNEKQKRLLVARDILCFNMNVSEAKM